MTLAQYADAFTTALNTQFPAPHPQAVRAWQPQVNPQAMTEGSSVAFVMPMTDEATIETRGSTQNVITLGYAVFTKVAGTRTNAQCDAARAFIETVKDWAVRTDFRASMSGAQITLVADAPFVDEHLREASVFSGFLRLTFLNREVFP
jgi:hypothetical protein